MHSDRERLLYRVTMVLGVVALVLVVINAVLLIGNQQRQSEVNARQAFINQSVRLSRLNQGLVNTLAQAAVKNKDDDIRKLLSENGIEINVTAPAAPASTHSPAAAAGSAKTAAASAVKHSTDK